MSQTTSTDAADGRTRSVLEEEREFLLRSLRDLEAERAAGDIGDMDYRALRDDYTVRAAEVLRQIAAREHGSAGAPGPSGASTVASRGDRVAPTPAVDVRAARSLRRRKRVVTAVAVVLIVGGAGWAAAGVAGVRLPGEAAPEASNAQLLLSAETAYDNGKLEEAIMDYQAVLKRNPADGQALTGQGAVLVEVGESGRDKTIINSGMAELARAEAADPSYGPAYGYRGLGSYYEGDYKQAISQLDLYLAHTAPKSRLSDVKSFLAKAKAELKGSAG